MSLHGPAPRAERRARGGPGARGLRVWRRDAAALALLWLVVTGVALLWNLLDTRPPHWDRANHLLHSLVYLDFLRPDRIGEWLLAYAYYPPLVYWVSDVAYQLLGTTDAWVAVLSQSVFLAVLILATYAMGRAVAGPAAGLLAPLFVATTPMISSGSRDYMLDAPLAAMGAAALALLMRSEHLTRLRPTLAFGLVCGLGMLTKWTFVFALAVPAMVALAIAARRAVRERRWRTLLPAVGGLATAFAVAGPWYLLNRAALIRDAGLLSGCGGCGWYAQVEGDPPLLTLRALLWYAWDLLDLQLYLVPFLFFAIGLVVVLRTPTLRRRAVYPLVSVAGIYVVQTMLVSKDPRYSLTIVPAVAVLATAWIPRLTARRRRAVVTGLAAYCAGTVFAMTFGVPVLPTAIDVSLPRSAILSELPTFTPAGDFVPFRGARLWSQQGYPLGPFSTDRWHQEELLQITAADGGRPALWFQGPPIDTIWFNDLALRYFAKRYGVELVGDLAATDVAAIRSFGGEPIQPLLGFHIQRSFTLPDGTALRIYRRD